MNTPQRFLEAESRYRLNGCDSLARAAHKLKQSCAQLSENFWLDIVDELIAMNRSHLAGTITTEELCAALEVIEMVSADERASY